MNYSFDRTKFVCVNAPRGPQVLEVDLDTLLSTVHPVSEHETEEEANSAARAIDPSWQVEPQGGLDDLPTR